jgi:hypothetical protein
MKGMFSGFVCELRDGNVQKNAFASIQAHCSCENVRE